MVARESAPWLSEVQERNPELGLSALVMEELCCYRLGAVSGKDDRYSLWAKLAQW
jgi:hypothetical protein